MRKTIKDAKLKDFQMFFAQSPSGVSCLPYFERWLNQKYFDEYMSEYEASLDRFEKANDKWRELMEKSVQAQDIDTKIKWMKKAEKYRELVEKEEKLQRKLEIEQNKYFAESGDR